MPAPSTMREFRDLPVGLLDAPVLDIRTARDAEKLDELKDDILRRGVLFPIIVVPAGERYEVVDGFRRTIAATRAGLVVVPCCVYATKDAASEGIKFAANAYREDMSPAEEALFFYELFQHECHEDVDAVCALVGKKRSYVESRMDLLAGDDQVFAALRERRISIGVAQELNKLPAEDYRRFYLHLAVRDGASIALVSAWVTEWKKLYGTPTVAAAPIVPTPAPIVPTGHDPTRCVVCRQVDPRFIPELVSVHTHCRLAVLEKLIAAYHGEA